MSDSANNSKLSTFQTVYFRCVLRSVFPEIYYFLLSAYKQKCGARGAQQADRCTQATAIISNCSNLKIYKCDSTQSKPSHSHIIRTLAPLDTINNQKYHLRNFESIDKNTDTIRKLSQVKLSTKSTISVTNRVSILLARILQVGSPVRYFLIGIGMDYSSKSTRLVNLNPLNLLTKFKANRYNKIDRINLFGLRNENGI